MSEIAQKLDEILGTVGGGYLRDEQVMVINDAVMELIRLRRMVNIAQQKVPAEMLDAEERAERAEAELLDTNAEVVRLRRIVENVQSRTALDIVAEKMAAEDELARVVAVIVKCRETAGLDASPDGPTGDVTNLLHRGDLSKTKWARLLLERDDVQGRKVLERMLAYYEENDGKADDFGRLFIVIDASIALGREGV